jgi:hypothetical protein
MVNKSPEEIAAAVEVVARAYFERMFEERWDDLHENGIDKALHRACASEAIKALESALHQARHRSMQPISRSAGGRGGEW